MFASWLEGTDFISDTIKNNKHKIEKLKEEFKYEYECPPSMSDVIHKINEIIDYLNKEEI